MPDLEPLRRRIRVIRDIETVIAKFYPRGHMRCPIHLSVGQETVAVGVCSVLKPGDQVVSTHRNHAHYLAMGGDVEAMIKELHGHEDGCCGGRGGSMHLFDDKAGLLVSVPIVGSGIPIGVGVALAFKMAVIREQNNLEAVKSDHVVVVFMGDAAVEQGVFHESLNAASLWKLPVIFVIEDNGLSVEIPIHRRQPARSLVDLVRGYGIPAHQAPVGDLREIVELSAHATDHARRGDGPALIVAKVERLAEHCGPKIEK